jgi:hypothetical protein
MDRVNEVTDTTTTRKRHWAHFLPEPAPDNGWWGREAIAEHRHPEYWAWIWGYTAAQVAAAKEATNAE